MSAVLSMLQSGRNEMWYVKQTKWSCIARMNAHMEGSQVVRVSTATKVNYLCPYVAATFLGYHSKLK
jgi:hypothetical protein